MAFLLLTLLPCAALLGGGPADTPHAEAAASPALRGAVERGLLVVEKAARSYPGNRDCFSCHHQTLPMQAMAVARDHGFCIDHLLLAEQGRFSHRSFQERAARMRKGEGIGGTSMTVGYGLWALDLADWNRDETTDAMVAFLRKNQEPGGSWTRYTSRPPLEDSNITCTVLAARFLGRFASGEEPGVEAVVDRAKSWLLAAAAQSQEDLNFRLWGLFHFKAEAGRLESARASVLSGQRADGGWGQLPEMASDAYATGQTLFILQETGLLSAEPACSRGLRFLLDTQKEDGSWFVKSRSKPIQTLFDNGDPHGTDQFISIPATSWSTMALTRALPRARLRRL